MTKMEKEKIQRILIRWQQLIDDDFDNAKIMFKYGKWLMCAYFLQQTVEKLLKAYYVFKNHEDAPFVHNLVTLKEKTSIEQVVGESFKDFFEELNPFYIHARYPGYAESLALVLDKKKAKKLLSRTEEFKICLAKIMERSRRPRH